MAKINKSNVIQKAVNDLAISASDEKIPSETLDKVQLVYFLNTEFANVSVNNNATSSSAAATLYATPVNPAGDFFLTGVTLSFVKDATCDIATGSVAINATVNGVVRGVLSLSLLTLTAQNQSLSISLPKPLKIDKGTNIQRGAFTFSVGTGAVHACIQGIQQSSQ